MNTKKKIFIFILGLEAVAIAGLMIFLFYMNSDTVKVNRQLELAQHYLLEEDYEQAIVAYEIVIQIDPKNTKAYLGLAQAYTESGDLQKAIEVLEEGYENTEAAKLQEEKEAYAIELAKIEAQKQEETALTPDIESKPKNIVAETEKAASSEGTPQSEAMASVQTGFVTQDGELYYYDEQENMVTGWFDVNSNRYCARNDGSLYKDGEYEIDNINYLFGQDGICFGEIKDERWKQAYYDYIVNEASYQGRGVYALCFVDDNDVPEIYIRGNTATVLGGQGRLITYKDNIVYTYEQFGGFGYIPRSGLFHSYGGTMGFYSGEIVRLSDATWQKVAEYETGFVEYDDWIDYEQNYYIFNGQEVTVEQYDENIDALFNFDQALQWGDDQMQTMNLSSILAYLQS